MNIGEVIVNLRKQKGVKQKELASELGITATYLSLVETNQSKASISLLANIASFFEIPLNALLFKSLDVGEIKDSNKKKYFKAATPIVDALIEYLLPANITKGNEVFTNREGKTNQRGNTRLKV